MSKIQRVVDKLSTVDKEVKEVERFKVAQAAKKLGVSNQAVYKRLATVDERLRDHVFKENGITFLDSEAVSVLKEIFENSKLERVSTVDQQVETMIKILQRELEQKQEVIRSQQETLNQLISQNEENKRRSDTIIMRLSNQLGDFQKIFEFKSAVVNVTPRKIQPWQPPATIQDVLKEKPWYEKVFIKIFQPEKMRQNQQV